MSEIIYQKSFQNYVIFQHQDFNDILSLEDFSPQHYYGATKKHPLFIRKDYLKGEKDYLENLHNPLSSVNKHYALLVVEKNGDKVVIKLFQGSIQRLHGNAWFRITKNVNYISVNTKTGDVYDGHIENFQKKYKCSKKIRRNSFFMDPVNSLKSHAKNVLTAFEENCSENIINAFSEFMFNIDKEDKFENLSHSDRLLRFYLKKRNIKYPNNFQVYSHELRGPEIKKILKKNQLKLVESVMKKYSLKGNKIRLALHQCSRVNIPNYIAARNLFGDDWLNQDNHNIILNLLESTIQPIVTPARFADLISKDELKKVYGLFKQVYIHQNMNIHTLQDHMQMYTELKLYGEIDLKWTASESTDNFSREHMDWDQKMDHYKRGDYVRHYPEYMYKVISKPISTDFLPMILDNSFNYNDESNYQSNCVRGYIGKPSSLIISVRNKEDITERATVEYRLTIKNDLVDSQRVQSLGKFNKKLDDKWNPILLKLDEQVLSCVRDNRFVSVKLTKTCVNGTVLKSDTHWNDSGILRWNEFNIDHGQMTIF